MWTSPTTVNASAGMDSFLPYISEVTNFWFGRMLMIAIFMIFFFGYIKVKEDDYVGGFAVSSYVSFVIGLLLWVIGLLDNISFSVVVGITLVSSVILFIQRKTV